MSALVSTQQIIDLRTVQIFSERACPLDFASINTFSELQVTFHVKNEMDVVMSCARIGT